MASWLALVVAAYVVGSVPVGVLLGRMRGLDIRQHGSRNVGATNVGRVLGRRLGLLCFVLDLLKGAVPVVVAGVLMDILGRDPQTLSAGAMWWWLAVALAAIVGHMASLFLRFGGGKGVATGFGSMLAMWPLLTVPAAGALVTWAVVVKATRIVSVSSMLAAASVPVWYLAWITLRTGDASLAAVAHAAPPLVATIALAALVVWRHRANIARLRRGEEPRLGGH